MKTKGEQPIDNKAPRRKTKFVDADMEYDVNVNLGGGQLEEESDEEEGEGKWISFVSNNLTIFFVDFDPTEYESERQEYEDFMNELRGKK